MDSVRSPSPFAAAPRGLAGLRALWPVLLGALAFRYAAYAVMTAAALWAERRPAPRCRTSCSRRCPTSPRRPGELLGLARRVPAARARAPLDRAAPLGALHGDGRPRLARPRRDHRPHRDRRADPARRPGIGGRTSRGLPSCSRRGVFDRGAIAAYLTKDLFFSGHVATTFLLWLYLRAPPRLRIAALGAHPWSSPRCCSRTCTTRSTWWAPGPSPSRSSRCARGGRARGAGRRRGPAAG